MICQRNAAIAVDWIPNNWAGVLHHSDRPADLLQPDKKGGSRPRCRFQPYRDTEPVQPLDMDTLYDIEQAKCHVASVVEMTTAHGTFCLSC